MNEQDQRSRQADEQGLGEALSAVLARHEKTLSNTLEKKEREELDRLLMKLNTGLQDNT